MGAPTLVVTSAAPAMAASLRKDPGINGWVLNSVRSSGFRRYTVSVDSTVSTSSYPTPDGAPFGLYLYDTDPADVYTDATFTYWINDEQEPFNWSVRTGHSSLWSGPVRGTAATKADGNSYTPYTWTYTGTIDPSNTVTGSDGVERVWLGHFNVGASFRQANSSNANVTYWAERSITLTRDGVTEELTFERRQGQRGPYPGDGGARARRASARTEASAESSAPEAPSLDSTDAPTQESAEETVTTEVAIL